MKTGEQDLSPLHQAVVWGIFLLVAVLILYPIFFLQKPRPKARATGCLGNVRQIGMALGAYAQDYDAFPLAQSWVDGLSPYVKNHGLFQCPSAPEAAYDYAYVGTLQRVRPRAIPTPDVIVTHYDSTQGRINAFDVVPGQSIAPRHNDGYNAGFADGHARWLREGKLVPMVHLWTKTTE